MPRNADHLLSARRGLSPLRTLACAMGLSLSALMAQGLNAQAQAQEAPAQRIGELALGLEYSSLYKGTASLALSLGDPETPGTDFRTSFRTGEEGQGGSLRLNHQTGTRDQGWLFSVGATASDWTHSPFSSTGILLEASRLRRLSPRVNGAAGVFARFDSIDRLDDSAGLLSRDAGDSTAFGFQGFVQWQTAKPQSLSLEQPQGRLRGDLRLAPFGERNFASVEVSAARRVPLSQSLALQVSGELGAVSGAGDGYVSILDRAFLGDTLPRGFAWGGLGPTDSTGDTPLGATRYAAASLDLLTQPTSLPFLVGPFVDIGGSWSVPGVTGAAQTEAALRASAGLAIRWEGRHGQLTASWAEPLKKEPLDALQSVSISFSTRF